MGNENKDEQFYKSKNFNVELCRIKHKIIDKEIEDIKGIEKENRQEINKKIEDLKKDLKKEDKNIKNKIVLTEKTVGTKIDTLAEFDEKLRGNGKPGIWETVRATNKKVTITFWIVVVMFIFMLGGDWQGISLNTIKNKIGIGKEIKQVEDLVVEEPVVIEPVVIEPVHTCSEIISVKKVEIKDTKINKKPIKKTPQIKKEK